MEINCTSTQSMETALRIYLSSPCTQQQAEHCEGMPVLLSFATWRPWMTRYQASYARILIDSGAFSELNTGKKIDLQEYGEWSQQWIGHADAIAGLDDISGDWRRSLDNYGQFPQGFPTIHDTDPPEMLKDLVQICQERNQWLGIGLKPPRTGKAKFVKSVLDNIPSEIHVHGWALREYSKYRRFDTMDSTNWFRDAFAICSNRLTKHLTYGEALEIIVKRYVRESRTLGNSNSSQESLFENEATSK